MPSERVQRQIDSLLDEAEQAIKRSEWTLVEDRARNVLALDPENADALAYVAAAARRLAHAAVNASVLAPPPPAGVQPSAFAGGRYQVKRFLGEGGKKRVYLAHDTRLDRDVAFALIKTEGLDQEGLDRITREAQAMGRLGTHPHIVSVYDMGQEPANLGTQEPGSGEPRFPDSHVPSPYLVTEFMPGGDVEGLLGKAEGCRLPIEQAVDIAQQVCEGLEFAHQHGLIHRDLKPGNVWLTDAEMRNEKRETSPPSSLAPHTSSLVAKIGDFGLAVALDRSRLTQAGMMVGTVAYMPPEQAMGGEVTFRSDLYSLGAMLYEMVCGRPPFIGEESVAVITQHLNTPPVTPTWHRPDLPPGLEALILRLLEKYAEKRPESATEVR